MAELGNKTTASCHWFPLPSIHIKSLKMLVSQRNIKGQRILMRQIFLKRQYSIQWANIFIKILDMFNATTFLYQGPFLWIHATVIILIIYTNGSIKCSCVFKEISWILVQKLCNLLGGSQEVIRRLHCITGGRGEV